MEQVREDDSVAGAAECTRKDSDPPSKLEGHKMLGSQMPQESGGSGWPECSPHAVADGLEGNDSNGCITSLAESQPPSTSASLNDTRIMVEELTMKNYGRPNIASSDSGGKHFRRGQWQHLYQLAGGSRNKSLNGGTASREKDPAVLSVREDLKRRPSDFQDLKLFSSKQSRQDPEEISAHLGDGYNKIMSTNKLHLRDSGLKISPASTLFPQFSVKKTLKGKGVACSNQGARTISGVSAICQNDETPANVTGVASDALLNSSAKNIQCSLYNIDRLGPESPHGFINLRDLLKPGCRKLNKVQQLSIFKEIVELVEAAHSQGVALSDIRPSCFILLPSNKVKYAGPLPQREIQGFMHHNMNKDSPLEHEHDIHAYETLDIEQQKSSEHMDSSRHQFQFSSTRRYSLNKTGTDFSVLQDWSNSEHKANTSITAQQRSISLTDQLEKKWYATPEELDERGCTFSANIYGLGVLLFELLCSFESWEMHAAAMLDLQRRVLPPKILSENPVEVGFCLWLLHPDPSARPTTRKILQSELLSSSRGLHARENFSHDDADSELLLHCLTLMEEQKQKHAGKLVKDLQWLDADTKEVERRIALRGSWDSSWTQRDFCSASEQRFLLEDPERSCALAALFSKSNINDAKLMKIISQLENAYFSMRSQTHPREGNGEARSDTDLLKNREKWSQVEIDNAEPCMNRKPADRLGAFLDSVCKLARYSKLEVCGTLRNGDLLNSYNVMCSMSFDRDDDYIATAGVSKKIKIFEFNELLNDSVDIHYPVIEMSNKSKLSCVCWNNYIKNYLASTDYDGVVQMWDASVGQGFSQYTEHQKRAWSVDFSQFDPKRFVSGSDDCSVKLWSINEKNSTSTIRNPANVCCVQFSAYSSHLLVFGSADYKIYCYDLRNTRIPWCTLDGHGKTVSYVKFIDSDTLVSASTDNTLKLWDLNKTSSTGLSSSACSLTFSGHINEKNFVGLSVLDGYIACGSESNEVFTYYRSLPMPITSYKFGSVDPISGHEVTDGDAQFVSSVCWRQKSNMVVAANSTGNMKVLQMV